MEQEQTSPAVTMGLRTQEHSQLEKFVPSIIDYLQGLGLDDSASELEEATIEIAETERFTSRYEATATADDWRTVIGGLSNLDGLDAGWLRKKLAKRLHDRVDEMKEVADASE